MTTTKKLHLKQASDGQHWVGNAFFVRTLIDYNRQPEQFSPFLLLDHAGPNEFEPTDGRRGVGEHPHRGFETVTIVYDGQVDHRDSSGGGGTIGPGDVQWMTAASGLVHEEFHSPNFSQKGGPFEMVQLWVNLPAADKSAPPNYQGIIREDIPSVKLPNDQGKLRLIAGGYQGTKGPAHTFTPINIWDLRVKADKEISLSLPEGFTTILVVLAGSVTISESEILNQDEVGLFEREGTLLKFKTNEGSKLLLLSGEPINEPIAAQGPFVMNHPHELREAMMDYQSGKMGHLH